MQKQTTYVGMDVHARTIRVAVLRPNEAQREEWGLANEPRAVASLARRLLSEARGPVVACYEAGPTGFALMRQLRAKGVDCRVIAPALIPRKPGDRVKTDRRDARNLAELLRAGLLTEVHAPTLDQEAVRDLSRAREDAVTDRKRAQHRLSKLLLRRGLSYGKRNWTLEHRAWLRTGASRVAAHDLLRPPSGAGDLRRLPPRARGGGGAVADAGAGARDLRGGRRLPRGGGAAALLPRRGA